MVTRSEKSASSDNWESPADSREQPVSILGIGIDNASKTQAIDCIEELIQKRPVTAHAIYIVNAHTLNLAAETPGYHKILKSAYRVYGDGTGVRWAARQRGVLMRDNLVGTDLIPKLFEITAGRGYRYFLLGATSRTVSLAAQHCAAHYPGWEAAGFHHGYLDADSTVSVIKSINDAKPDLLLVGMGNPKQEQWIHDHLHELEVPVAMGVGGLLDHWAGNLTRAPLWVRKKGFEWLQLLLQQPHKWKRYLIGNPKFLVRILLSLSTDRS
jgi:N-acetylglucosaminyldiphosphoundecaprenol N-acetyl-beta-D-mannosaminyltransferase